MPRTLSIGSHPNWLSDHVVPELIASSYPYNLDAQAAQDEASLR